MRDTVFRPTPVPFEHRLKGDGGLLEFVGQIAPEIMLVSATPKISRNSVTATISGNPGRTMFWQAIAVSNHSAGNALDLRTASLRKALARGGMPAPRRRISAQLALSAAH